MRQVLLGSAFALCFFAGTDLMPPKAVPWYARIAAIEIAIVVVLDFKWLNTTRKIR